MKIILKFKSLIYLLVVFAFACEDSGKENIPNSSAVVTFSPIINYDRAEGGGYPNAYRGDTVRFSIEVTTPLGLKEIRMMDLKDDVPTEIGSFTPITQFQQDKGHTFEFKYYLEDTVTKNFFVQVTESTKAINTNTINTKNNPIIKVSPKDIKEYKNLRLYNSLGAKENFFRLDVNDFLIMEVKGENSVLEFLYNPTIDYISSSTFIRGWQSGNDPGSVNGSVFVKVVGFDYEKATANQIQNAFNSQASQASFSVNDVKSGDMYLAKVYYGKDLIINRIAYSYAVIKVVSLADDLLRTSQGGRDDDYIEFDMKTFNNNRFPQ